MGASMQLVWDHILPAMEDVKSKPEEKQATQKLLARTEQISLPIATSASGDILPSVAGKRSYTFDDNKLNAQKVSFVFGHDECDVTLVENGKTTRIKSGHRRWVTADNKREPNALFFQSGRALVGSKFSSNYYWADRNKLVMTLKYVETAHADVFTFLFTEAKMEMSFNNSVAIMQNKADDRPTLSATPAA
jgi:hypothetical protein